MEHGGDPSSPLRESSDQVRLDDSSRSPSSELALPSLASAPLADTWTYPTAVCLRGALTSGALTWRPLLACCPADLPVLDLPVPRLPGPAGALLLEDRLRPVHHPLADRPPPVPALPRASLPQPAGQLLVRRREQAPLISHESLQNAAHLLSTRSKTHVGAA